ncbi:MAG: ABC transporter substrate-binding protein [Holosporales bacterium]|jgi:putative ABC transport system substrate-binding protein|nr:ABC transporter substrate-binding protein [Holosporales bacterium]
MKKFLAMSLCASLALLEAQAKPSMRVKICKAVEHAALNSSAAGVADFLKQKGAEQGISYDVSVDTCQGNMALASQIMEKVAGEKVDVVVTIGTLPSQCAYRLAKKGKLKAVVFVSVTNPDDVARALPHANVTGVSNFVPLEPQIELFKKIQPGIKTLGVLYNPGEPNSVAIVERLRPVCEKMGVVLKLQAIPRASDIPQATERLAKEADALFISNDNLALSAIPNIVALCSKRKVPVYVSDTDQVAHGCLASLGPNQYEIGRQAGKMVAQIAEGKSPNTIPVEYAETRELHVNTKGPIGIPESVRAEAHKVL